MLPPTVVREMDWDVIHIGELAIGEWVVIGP